MESLSKARITEIAKEHGTKTIPLAKFLVRISTIQPNEVPLALKEFSENKTTTRKAIQAAEAAMGEMGISLKKPKKKKDGVSKPKKKSTPKTGKETDKDSSPKARVTNYNYPEDATSDEKKKFRTTARSGAKKWAKTIGEGEGKENKEYQAFLKETYCK